MPSRFSYSRWDGTQVGFELDADRILDEITDDLLYHGDLNAALRRMMQSGLRDRNGERMQGIRDMLEQLRRRRKDALEQFDLGGVYEDIAEELREVVQLERDALEDQMRQARESGATGRLALSDTRRLLGVLREPDSGEAARSPLPTLDELDELVTRVRAAGLPVRYEIDGSPPAIAPGVQLTLYRLVQEALTNTMKHAGPGASAVVRVHYADGEVGVEIEDDGYGSADQAPGSGRGLAGMRERVHAFGGEVRSGPRTPRGWAVSARLRLEEVDRS